MNASLYIDNAEHVSQTIWRIARTDNGGFKEPNPVSKASDHGLTLRKPRYNNHSRRECDTFHLAFAYASHPRFTVYTKFSGWTRPISPQWAPNTNALQTISGSSTSPRKEPTQIGTTTSKFSSSTGCANIQSMRIIFTTTNVTGTTSHHARTTLRE